MYVSFGVEILCHVSYAHMMAYNTPSLKREKETQTTIVWTLEPTINRMNIVYPMHMHNTNLNAKKSCGGYLFSSEFSELPSVLFD